MESTENLSLSMATPNSSWNSSRSASAVLNLPTFIYLPEYVLFTILSLMAIIGDTLTLLAIRMKKVRVQNDILIQALATYDICNCLFVSPVAIIPFAISYQSIDGYKLLCKIVGMARVFFNVGSLTVVVLMAMERRLAITSPFLHRIRINKRVVRKAIIIASLVIITGVIVPSFLGAVHYGPIDRHGMICYIQFGQFNILANGTNTQSRLGSFIANAIVTIVVAILVITLVCMNGQVVSLLSQRCKIMQDKGNELYLNKVINYCPLCKLMIFISVLALLAYAPYVIYGVVSSFGVRLPLRAEIWIFNLFVWLNMFLNPIAYGMARKQYRTYYLYFLKKSVRIMTFRSSKDIKVVDNERYCVEAAHDLKSSTFTKTTISRLSSKSCSIVANRTKQQRVPEEITSF
ncbi:Prostaglandin E2 receptor EP3 subtype [Trichoplax sp. H2]|nr:Prostaglandin E2 receptor EP3 subtype [Trichoplax sp. H2]|eukprot:RDD40732.1 Prostaglandin E2 receptor EP3 subtype [Trichoplax sp. H2]